MVEVFAPVGWLFAWRMARRINPTLWAGFGLGTEGSFPPAGLGRPFGRNPSTSRLAQRPCRAPCSVTLSDSPVELILSLPLP